MKKLVSYLLLLLIPFNLMGSKGQPPLQVTLLPIGDMKPQNITLIKKTLEKYYTMSVTVALQQVDMEDFYSNTHKDLIVANKVLPRLDKMVVNKRERILAITDEGLTLGGGGFTIRGLASINGTSAIVSSKLILEESTSRSQFKDLLLKAALHEVGHMLGLEHCESGDKCFMVSSLPDPKDFYNSPKNMCSNCKKDISVFLK